MQHILILGAGRSSQVLIETLYHKGQSQNWSITVADTNLNTALDRVKELPGAVAVSIDISDKESAAKQIEAADIVVSLLPAFLHPEVALLCLEKGKHLTTASYVSSQMAALHEQAANAGLIFLNECGLDPGLDHMSAMQIINRLRDEGGEITSFKSWCGGLPAPASNTNPWGYKISWNPRNVVLAGQGTAAWLEDGKIKYRPYSRIFDFPEPVEVAGSGRFEGYPNRDSLSYRAVYGLNNISTLLRGTLRNPGYCKAWNLLVQLGLTDDTYTLSNPGISTKADLLSHFVPGMGTTDALKERTARYLGIAADSVEMDKLDWLGLFGNESLGLDMATPAQALQKIIEEKWAMKPNDRDMIVMQHSFSYTLNGISKTIHSSLTVEGTDSVRTAMALTVGLPLALATELVLQGKIKKRGVLIPVSGEIYEPILAGLQAEGLVFTETEGE